MKFYLSSFKLGNKTEQLKEFFSSNPKVAYIPNALDFSDADPARRSSHVASDINDLKALGLDVQELDLRNYFGRKDELQKVLSELGGIWISGGNVFVLRQAIKLSGLDEILLELTDTDFVYGGYSAAGCVLSPTLKGYDIVDPIDTPYPECKEVIWEGLGLIDSTFLPHFDSDHPESADISREVAYCKQHNLPYTTLRDGEVLIIE